MEILSNFASIYCFITFIIGAVFMFIAVCIVSISKIKEPKNKVKFFIEKETSNRYLLYIKNKNGICYICSNNSFKKFGLNPDDFTYMKEGEIREVFINLED